MCLVQDMSDSPNVDNVFTSAADADAPNDITIARGSPPAQSNICLEVTMECNIKVLSRCRNKVILLPK
jgi:hypothetical protein